MVSRASVWGPVDSNGHSVIFTVHSDIVRVWCPVNLSVLYWGDLRVTLQVFRECDLVVEEICPLAGLIQLIFMECDISLLSDVTVVRKGVIKCF